MVQRTKKTSAALRYAETVAKVRAFTAKTFPSFSKASRADKSRATRMHAVIFGKGDKKKPIIGAHTTVVHLIQNKTQKKKIEKAAAAYQKLLDPEKTDVEHVFQVATTKQIKEMKKQIGQQTPDDINAIFIPKDKLPGKKDEWSSGDVIELVDRYMVSNGDQLKIFRIFNISQWASDPVAEEKRVLKQLEADAVRVRAHFKTVHRSLPVDAIRFSPIVGNHQYYGSGLNEAAGVHALLAKWRHDYGKTSLIKPGQAPVSEFLTGIMMTMFLSTSAKRQYNAALQAQYKRRVYKIEMRKRLAREREGLSYQVVMAGGRVAARDTIAQIRTKLRRLTSGKTLRRKKRR